MDGVRRADADRFQSVFLYHRLDAAVRLDAVGVDEILRAVDEGVAHGGEVRAGEIFVRRGVHIGDLAAADYTGFNNSFHK